MGYYDNYDYMYDYSTGSGIENELLTIVMMYLMIFLIWGIYELVCYIIKGIGLYRIAKRQGEDYPWLAFVPFARTYLHGELAGPIVLKKKSIRNPGIWMLVLPFIQGVAVAIVYIIMWVTIFGTAFRMIGENSMYYDSYSSGSIAGALGTFFVMLLLICVILIVFAAVKHVLCILVNHQILEKFTSKNMSIVHAVLAIFIPMYEPICLLVMSKKPYNPGMEPNLGTPFMQTPPNGPISNGPVPDGPMPNGPIPNGAMPNGPVPNEPMPKEETPEAFKSGFIPQRGLLDPEKIVPPNPQTAPAMEKPEPPKPEEAPTIEKPEPPKPEEAPAIEKPEPPKPEEAPAIEKPEPPKAEEAQADSVIYVAPTESDSSETEKTPLGNEAEEPKTETEKTEPKEAEESEV